MPTITRRSLLMLTSVAAVLSAAPAGAADKLQIVTTITDLAAITRTVGGDKVNVTTIATGREDPHFIAAKPSYMMAARKADLWIRVGMELEIGYEPLILDGSRNPKIRIGTPGHLDASTGVLRLEVPTQKVDRSMGDVHPLGNPHYLLDPLNGRLVAKHISQRLTELAPQHAAYFAEQLKSFRRELDKHMFGPALVERMGGGKLWALLLKDQLDEALVNADQPNLAGWLATMRPHAGKKIITYHRNWSYFAHRFGLTVANELEPKPGIPPSPGHVADVIKQVKAQGIGVLLMAQYYDRKPADLVASEAGVTVVECAMMVGGQPEASDYLTLIDNLVTRLDNAFTS